MGRVPKKQTVQPLWVGKDSEKRDDKEAFAILDLMARGGTVDATQLNKVGEFMARDGLSLNFPKPGWEPGSLCCEFLETCKRLGISPEKYTNLPLPPHLVMKKDLHVAPCPLPDFDIDTDPAQWGRNALAVCKAYVKEQKEALKKKIERYSADPHLGAQFIRPHKRRRVRVVPPALRLEWAALYFIEGRSLICLERDRNPERVSRQAIETVLRELAGELGFPYPNAS